MSFIQKLREKPEHVRVRILFVTLALCVPVILILWHFSGNLISRPKTENDTPRAGFGSGIRDIFQNIFSGEPEFSKSLNEEGTETGEQTENIQ